MTQTISKGIEGVHGRWNVSMATEQEEAWSGKEVKRVLMRRVIPSLQDRPCRGFLSTARIPAQNRILRLVVLPLVIIISLYCSIVSLVAKASSGLNAATS
jgi:hypothetical protein